jgi:hypothetical protein
VLRTVVVQQPVTAATIVEVYETVTETVFTTTATAFLNGGLAGTGWASGSGGTGTFWASGTGLNGPAAYAYGTAPISGFAEPTRGGQYWELRFH